MIHLRLACTALLMASCATTQPPERTPSPYEGALAESSSGQLSQAWDAFATLAATFPPGPARRAAVAWLVALADLVPLDGKRVEALPAEAREAIYARLGDEARLAEARRELGAIYRARASHRVKAWPGAMEVATTTIADDTFGPERDIASGWLASEAEGPGLYAFRIRVDRVGPAVIEARSDGALAVFVAGRLLGQSPRLDALAPSVLLVPVSLGPDSEIEVRVADRADRARARVFVSAPEHADPAPPAPPADDPALDPLAALDDAVARGDIAAAARAEERLDPALPPALRELARARFAAIDVTRPPELRQDAPGFDASDHAGPADPARTSCAARAAILLNEGESLRYRPAAVVALSAHLPALVGACADAAFRAGELLLDTFQLDAARALGERLERSFDPGPEREAATGLLARVGQARGGPLVHEPERTASPGLVLAPARDIVRRAPSPLPPGQHVLLAAAHVHVAANGRLTLEHQVIACAGDAAATESLGELVLPDDAELILARTWRRDADGARPPRPLEPEDIVEKATVSLPELLPNDCAEWAYRRELPPDPRLPAGGFMSPAIAMQNADGPVARASVTITADPDVRPNIVIEPDVATLSHPDATTWIVDAENLPAEVAEPLDPAPAKRRLHVHVWGGFERDAWVGALAAEAQRGLVITPRVAAFVADANLAAAGESPRARLFALYQAVITTVEGAAEGPLANASWAFWRGRGERAVALVAACRAAGLACDLVLARPLSEGPDADPAPDPEGWAYPLVRARLPAPDGELWLDPMNPFMPPGLLPPLVQGVPAVVLTTATEPPLTTPRFPDQGHRVANLVLKASSDGLVVEASGAEVLDGVYAASWRQALAPLSPTAQQRLFASLVEQALPGANVSEIVIEPTRAGRSELVWRFTALAPTEPAGGRARAVKLALLPEALARGTVQVPTRTAPLLVNRATDLTLTVDLQLADVCQTTTGAPCDWVFVSAPAPSTRIDHPSLVATRDLHAEGATLHLTKALRVRPALIEPTQYDRWKDAALASERLDYVQIVFAPLPRSAAPR